jgi:hypothetical protein
MQKTNLIALSVLTAVLLSSAFVALATADDGTSSASVPPYDPKDAPDQSIPADMPPPPDARDNSTVSSDDQIYHILANQTVNGDTPEPGSAEDTAPLIAPAPQNSSGNSLPFVVAGIVLAVAVGGVLGMAYYRRQARKAEN